MMTALVMSLVAQTAAPADGLTAEEAVRRALAHAPELEAQRAVVAREAARAGRVEIDPLHVHFDHRAVDQLVFGQRVDNNGVAFGPLDRSYWAVGLRAPALSQLGVSQSVDAQRAEALELDLEGQRRAIAAEVRLLHASALLRAEEASLVKEAIALGTRMRDAVTAKLSAQAATEIEASAAELELLDLQVDLDDVEAQRSRTEARLGRLTANGGPVRVTGELPVCAPPPAAASVLAISRERSWRLEALRRRDQAFDTEGIANALRFVPWINEVTVGYLKQETDQRDDVRAVVEVDVPVFAFFDGKGRDLELRRARAAAERREAEAALSDDVASAVERLTAAAMLVDKHRSATDEIARRSTAAVDAALSSGNVDVVTASEVYARALKSRRSHLRARERCVEAAIDVMRLTGDVAAVPGDAEPGPDVARTTSR